MKHPQLKVEKRKVLGKKVKNLRKEGILPANIYGKDIKSTSVQVSYKDFDEIYKQVGSTGIVDVEFEEKTIPSLIHSIQTDYHRIPLHADFFKVNLKEKIKTMIPLSLVGEPKAVSDKLGLLMEILHEIEVEALPEELPENIEINVENLATVDEQITVGDIKAPQGAVILTDPGQVIAKIAELIVEEPEPEEPIKGEGEEGVTEGEGEGKEEGEKKEEAGGEKPKEEQSKPKEEN
ncbi:MAG TPA: 50S ribosomal protein L25 [Patescibacteria group bacterium]|nr:50S ribosomal protein L25 [Patescibacteria group bacterium]